MTKKINLIVHSMFHSIMGERGDGHCAQGDWAVFLRLAGCNLRCKWCDTRQALAMDSGKGVEVKEVFDTLIEMFDHFPRNRRTVLLTGGEPLLQMDGVLELIRMCYGTIFFVIETNGAVPIHALTLHNNVTLVVDYKGPSSGEVDKMVVSLKDLRQRDAMKFVIANEEDYRCAKEVIERHDFIPPLCSIVMSPVIGPKALDNNLAHQLYEWIKRDHLFSAGINIQLHKMLKVE